MQLYSDTLLNELAEQQASSDCILGQMAGGAERQVLEHLGRLFDKVASPVQDRWVESLRSTDNRRFFQGFGEAVSAAFLVRSGWEVVDVCSPMPCLIMRHPDGRELRVVTLAFLKTPVTPAEQEAKELLARVVNRADSDHRITILVKKWNTHKFDPEPIRRCVDIWLTAIRKGEWQGKYATYEDDYIHLEFALTDEPTQPGQGSVAFLLAPSNGLHTMEVVEGRLVYELDNLFSKAPDGTNILVSMATNTAWGLPPGLIRSMFYGRPVWSVADGHHENRKYGFKLGDEPALFQVERYKGLGGALVIDRPEGRGPCGRAYLNPWSNTGLSTEDLSCASFAHQRAEEDGYRVMGWAQG